MNATEAAILRTVLYADVFDYALTSAEIHLYLIHDQPVTTSRIESALKQSTSLNAFIQSQPPYYALHTNSNAIPKRLEREAITRDLWPVALHYSDQIASIPFVRMVALTGALAVHNPASHGDDIDYVVVVEPGRVWLARLMTIALVRLARLKGVHLCPNYVMATNQLVQQRQDLFIAHEVAQMIPLYGQMIYDQFIQQNAWIQVHMPNLKPRHVRQSNSRQRIKKLLERLLSGWPGDRLEQWEYTRKKRKLAANINADSSAIIDQNNVKGHFDDHGSPILQAYYERLVEHDLDTAFLTGLPAVAV